MRKNKITLLLFHPIKMNIHMKLSITRRVKRSATARQQLNKGIFVFNKNTQSNLKGFDWVLCGGRYRTRPKA